MTINRLRSIRAPLIWAALALAMAVPVAFAAASPLLAWREPIYIVAGLAGVTAMALMLLQPLLAAGYLPRLTLVRARSVHRWIGALLVALVLVHVVGLYFTSPPDVIDVLLFRSPTPFSVWGVIAMWAVFLSALFAWMRQSKRLRPRTFRLAHAALAALIVVGTIAHALLIEGTMETVSKIALSALIFIAAVKSALDLRLFVLRRRHAAAETERR